jgi:hypothetical protein
MWRIRGLRRKDNGARHSPSAGARYRRGVPSADLLQLAEAFDRVLGLDQTTSRKANRNLCTVGRGPPGGGDGVSRRLRTSSASRIIC